MKPFIFAFALLFCSYLLPAISIGQIKNKEKISVTLKSALAKKKGNVSVEVFLTMNDLAEIKNDNNIQILSEYKSTNTVLVRISSEKLLSLLDKKEIVFADVYRTPKDELTTGSLDITLNKIAFAHNQFPTVNGESINVSLKEQRFDTTDIDIRGRSFESGVAANVQSSHAAIMATILAGAGNSSPYAKGAAWGANLTSSNYITLLPDADAVYQQHKISVQNHSYGTGIENYYGADAASYDMNVWNHPTLLHVFSSGNSGGNVANSGIYSGITGLANLTGSFKMAKNIITVGATDSFNLVSPLSSKGPGFDGRVKPDIVAFGEDGSSGAAALVSGAAALIQQAYKTTFNSLPSAALVKAVLLNSADDIGEKHVDYTSGYGSLNAYEAVNTVRQNRFFESTVLQNEVKSFPIAVPAGISQLKITLAWTDTAAIANATKALVNDVDALLQLPAINETWQPWVLSSYPSKDSLLLPSVRKRDSLNNVEQITIDNPQAGNYLLEVRGNKIQTVRPQSFAVAYQLDTVNNFYWTFPTSPDVLLASKRNIIRWQTNVPGSASIDFSTNGTQWQTIASSVNLSDQYFKWDAPDTITAAFLRMNLPSLPPVTSNNFVISKPTSISVGFNCSDSFLLYWNKFKTNQYQLYQLGTKYLEPLRITADSFVIFQKQQHPNLFYSVAPLINSKPGFRSFTINYATQGAGCYVKTFFALLQNVNAAILTAELGTLYNVAEASFQKITPAGVQTLKTISGPLTSMLDFTDLQLTQGVNTYRLQLKLNNGSIVYSNTDVVYYFPEQPVLVYPNPAKHNQPIKIIAQDPGVYSIKIYDVNGRLVHQQLLDNIAQQLKTVYLSTGFYLVKVIKDDGKIFIQKLVVY